MEFNPPAVANPAAFLVMQAAIPPGDGNLGNDVPAWAVTMQNNINNTMIANHNAAMAGINAAMARIANIEERLANIEARAFNSMASETEDVITVIRNNEGIAPDGFPDTLLAFYSLTNAQTIALLEFYGLELTDFADFGNQRLRRHLGIRTSGG
jgi:hypothetical protein